MFRPVAGFLAARSAFYTVQQALLPAKHSRIGQNMPFNPLHHHHWTRGQQLAPLAKTHGVGQAARRDKWPRYRSARRSLWSSKTAIKSTQKRTYRKRGTRTPDEAFAGWDELRYDGYHPNEPVGAENQKPNAFGRPLGVNKGVRPRVSTTDAATICIADISMPVRERWRLRPQRCRLANTGQMMSPRRHHARPYRRSRR